MYNPTGHPPLSAMATMMASEIRRFIDTIVLDRIKDDEQYTDVYSSKTNVSMKNLVVTFSLHNSLTDTIIHKTYDMDVFAHICSDKVTIIEEFNELVDDMIKESKRYFGKEVLLNNN